VLDCPLLSLIRKAQAGKLPRASLQAMWKNPPIMRPEWTIVLSSTSGT
jgi:hypothetical protein